MKRLLLVLPTAAAVGMFREHITPIEDHVYSIDELGAEIVRVLQIAQLHDRQQALTSLVEHYSKVQRKEEDQQLVRTGLLSLFSAINQHIGNLYIREEDGRLMFEFDRWLDDDLVISRIQD